MSTERVFVIGGTGHVGSVVARGLLDKNIRVTLNIRSSRDDARYSDKIRSLFNHDLVDIVEGDYAKVKPEDTDANSKTLKEALKGHKRLFLLLTDLKTLARDKENIATYAYEAGVEQIVDLSSMWVSMPLRASLFGDVHLKSEKAMLAIPGRGTLVTLRPGKFMSNNHIYDHPVSEGAIYDTTYPEVKIGWVSPNDIGNVAAVILSEPIDKHGDGVYELNSDVVSSTERAEILSKVLSKKIRYEKVEPVEKYDKLMAYSNGYIPHLMAMDLCADLTSFDNQLPRVGGAVSILLRRKPETLEAYLEANRSLLK